MKQLVIETKLLLENIGIIKQQLGSAALIGVVKGNGYGLGAVELANILLECGVPMLAVSTIEEAQVLRDAGIDCEILLLSSFTVREDAERILDLRLTAAIGSALAAAALNSAAVDRSTRARAHLKIDTGFGRYGFLPEEAESVVTVCRNLTNVDITGIFSHLSVSFGDEKYCRAQFDAFLSVIETLRRAGIEPGMRHIANSCAAVRFPDMHLDAVRIGSALLGRLPIRNTWKLHRIARLEATIDEIRYLPKGHNVGYANVCTLRRASRIAVAPVGGSDGFSLQKQRDAYRFTDRLRYLWTDLKFLLKPTRVFCTIGGKRAPVLGRVGLTNVVIDVTRIDAKAGDVAVFPVNPLYVDSALPRRYE